MKTDEDEERYGKGVRIIKGKQMTIVLKSFDDILTDPLQFSTKNTTSLSSNPNSIKYIYPKQQKSPFTFGPVDTSAPIIPHPQLPQNTRVTNTSDQELLVRHKFGALVAHFDIIANEYSNSTYQFPLHEPTFFPDD